MNIKDNTPGLSFHWFASDYWVFKVPFFFFFCSNPGLHANITFSAVSSLRFSNLKGILKRVLLMSVGGKVTLRRVTSG